MANSCGSCNECCIGMQIKELQKKEHIPCVNLLRNKCAIYDERPPSCVTFNCTWLLSGWGKKFRPDKIGMIFMYHPQKGLIGKETRKNAFKNKHVKILLSKLNTSKPVEIQQKK